MKGLSGFAVKNKGAVVFTALLLSLIGFYLIYEIPEGVFPDATFPRMTMVWLLLSRWKWKLQNQLKRL